MKLIVPKSQRPVSTLRVYTLILFILFWTGIQTQSYAQYNKPQNDVWAFALNKGLNFLPGPAPVSMVTSSNTQEGSAAVSDNSGNLLFYTGGINGLTGAKVYDRTGAVMPNGSAIVPFATYSCTQAAAIVPVIGNPNQYYVFSLEQGGAGSWGGAAGFCRLYYCIVDMTLNGGFGDVIASTIATPLDSGLAEKMTVVAGDNCDIWLLTHKKDLPHFKAYNISSTGISAPVVSTATGEIPTGLNAYKIGTIKVSPNRTMISNVVLNGAYGGATDRLELLQFNPATGIVTGCQVLNTFTNQYDADFSPDNSKLYSRVLGGGIYQYDLSLLPSIPAVILSQFLVYASPDWGGQMKLGPNGKIYIQTGAGYVDCINSPNLAGSLCNFTYHAVAVGAASTLNLGMPNMQIVVEPADTTYARRDTSLCAGSATLTAPSGFTSYTWNTGATTMSIIASTAGTYWVNCVSACTLHVDTIGLVIAPNDTSFYRRDTSVCAIVSPITLPGPTGYSTYVWSTGSTASSISAPTSGMYRVYATTGCDTRVDTISLVYNPMPAVSLGNDTGFCVGNSLVLSSTQPAGSSYLWNTGSTGTSVTASSTGTYWLRVINNFGCATTDTIHITVLPAPVVNLGPDTTVCSGLPITLQSSVPYSASATYQWSTGATTSSIVASTTGTYWLSVSNSGCAGRDTINVTILFDTLTVFTHDTAICLGQSVYVAATGDPAIHCEWLPTAGIPVHTILNPTITPDTSATYVLTASFPGCHNLVDSFHIDVQPNPVVYMGGNQFVCRDDSLHIHAVVTPSWYTHYSYSWSPAALLDDSTASTVAFKSGDTTMLYVTVTTPAGCKGKDSAQIIVYPDSFARLDTTINVCPHDSVQLKPWTNDALASYHWSPSLYLENAGSAQPWVKAITTQAYVGIATSQYGCRDTLYANVVVRPAGTIYLNDSTTLYPGESYQLSPQTNCTSFFWFPPAGLSSPYISNPVATPLINTKYILHGYTEWGCPAVDSINIYMNGESILDVPNAFVPGSANNTFKVSKRGIARLNYLRIYNRWGNLIFETNDIDKGWDGTYKGDSQPFDVYVYQMEAVTNTGRVVEKHGNLTLLR